MIDASLSQGTGSIVYDHGTTNIDFGADTASEMRFFGLLNATVLDSWAGVGDMPAGAAQTWGMYNVEGTSDDWFKSDFIMVWVGNPSVSRMPEMHFMHEARYRGAKLVVIAPDYSPTAVHADYWLNPRIGTDAALALAMAQVILGENLHDEEYIREQTDLPILVRDDTSRYLRGSDIEKGGKEDLLYFWDAALDRLAEVPGCQGEGSKSLALGALSPALSGRYSVELADGSTVQVRPLLEHLREHLDANYTPEMAAGVTGVGEGTIRKLARELAAAKTAMIYSSWGACKHYHSDLPQRAEILLMALTGNQGKSGGGLRVAAWWPVEGFHKLSNPDMALDAFRGRRGCVCSGACWRLLRSGADRLAGVRGPDGGAQALSGLDAADALALLPRRLLGDLGQARVPRSRPAAKHLRVHEGGRRQGLDTDPSAAGKRAAGLRLHGSEPAATLAGAAVRGEVPVAEARDDRRRELQGQHLGDEGGPDPAHLRLLRARLAQVQPDLPALSPALREGRGAARRGEAGVGDLRPAGAQGPGTSAGARRQQGARRRQRRGGSLQALRGVEQLGRVPRERSQARLEWILEQTPSTGNMGLAEAEKTGLLPVIEASGGPDPLYSTATDYRPDRTLYPHARFVEGKEAWPTYSGRQQFLLDHPWYEEAGEALPVHKDPPMAGGDYSLRLSGGHTRWSIHATWRDTELMLRLQRGEPAVWVAERDAEQRGIADGDRIRVYNDVGEFEAIAKVAASVQPGEVITYHAWEPYQFKNWKGCQEPVPAPWKALHLAGGYGQLHYRSIYLVPGHSPRAQAVEIAKAG